MKKKVLVIFSLSKVRKSELPEIMNAILAIVEKHDPVALKIVGMYNLLAELKPLLDKLAVQYDGYPNPKEFVAQRKLRNKLLSVILSNLWTVENVEVASKAQQAALAVPFLKQYLKGIMKVNSSVKNVRINQLLINLEENDSINVALVTLSFTDYIAKLKTCQQYLNQAAKDRREILAIRPLFNTQDAQTRIVNAISNLLSAIELAKVEHTELDYTPLINELNVELSLKQSIIKSRATRKKNTVAKKTKAAESSAKVDSTADKTTTDAPSTTTDAPVA